MASAASWRLPAIDRRTILSSDLFDTLITRSLPHPTDLFRIVAHELTNRGLWAGDPQEWRVERQRTERDLRAARPESEVSLAEIHERLGKAAGWDATRIEAAMAAEAEIELRFTAPVARSIAWFNAAAGLCRDRIIICDTYLPRWLVERLIAVNGVEIAPDKIFLSVELGRTKAAGNIYPVIRQLLGLGPRVPILHVGDNRRSDVRNARAAGFRAFHWTATEQTPTERDAAIRSVGAPAAAAVAGAMRATRLGNAAGDGQRARIWESASGIAGPLVTGFVLWTLLEAQRRGLDRLHFLARDGQIMCRVAKLLQPLMPRPIECRYVYASRQALFLPSVTRLDAASLAWITERPGKTSFSGMLARIGLPPEAGLALCREAGAAADVLALSLDQLGPERIAAFLATPAIVEQILATAAERRAALLAYLREIGFWSRRGAIVDVGWHGRLQWALGRALAAEGRLPEDGLLGFYLALYQKPSDPAAGRMVTYLDAADGALPNERWPNGSVVEVFFAADHGSLERYRRNPEGGVDCVLRQARNHAALGWGLETQQQAIVACAERLAANAAALGVGAEELLAAVKTSSNAALARFLEAPSRAEAEAYGSFPHSEDQAHAELAELAPPVAPHRLIAAMLLPHRYPLPSLWRQGSVSRSIPAPAMAGVSDAFARIAAAKGRVRSILGILARA
jgi:FMN phosphatase YigB (HAD superfamily)